ncbi:hypothetical protein [Streptomyces sp. NPDC007070]
MVRDLRLPRVLVGLLVGACLGLGGALGEVRVGQGGEQKVCGGGHEVS